MKEGGALQNNMQPQSIDLNCDLGESYGAYRLGQDEVLMPYITSVNIACGFHAGDPAVIRETVSLCLRHSVKIGAHPGLPDLQGFGRRRLDISPGEAYELTLYQLGALEAFLRPAGQRLHHVKPHGALYNMAAADKALADSIAGAVRDFDPRLLLYGLSGSLLIQAGREQGLTTVSEVFADRAYLPNGTLAPRTAPGSVLATKEAAVAQALGLAVKGEVTAMDGTRVKLVAQTVCIHGDHPRAAALAASLRRALELVQLNVAAPLSG